MVITSFFLLHYTITLYYARKNVFIQLCHYIRLRPEVHLNITRSAFELKCLQSRNPSHGRLNCTSCLRQRYSNVSRFLSLFALNIFQLMIPDLWKSDNNRDERHSPRLHAIEYLIGSFIILLIFFKVLCISISYFSV